MFLSSFVEPARSSSNETHFSFHVEDAQPEDLTKEYTTPASLLTEQTHLKGPLEDFSHKNDRTTKFVATQLKGILGTIHEAYVKHLPLQLSVSDFILLIGQGIAKHMQIHAEDVRSHFVDFEGKEKITIIRDFEQGKENDWSTIFGEFSNEIRKRVKLDFYDVMVDDTSVATKLSRIASEITIMDTFQKYFAYEVSGCAITKVTLVGSSEDWEMLRNKVHKLKKFNEGDRLMLDWWLQHLVPLVDRIVDQAVSRNIDVEFWKDIYRFKDDDSDCLPDPTMTGWIKIFKPYLGEGQLYRSDFQEIYTSALTSDISRVPFDWIPTPEERIPMLIFGGVLGTKIHEDGTLESVYFYAVAKKGMEVADDDDGCIQDDDIEGSCVGNDSDYSDYSGSSRYSDDFEEEEELEEAEDEHDSQGSIIKNILSFFSLN